jgi:hypothetical protein
LLNERFPDLEFTSGLRDVPAQARVMATNQLRKPFWIGSTYKQGKELQKLINENSENLGSLAAMTAFIQQWLLAKTPEDLGEFSRHLGGYAFDIQPMLDNRGILTSPGFKVVEFIKQYVRPEKFLQWEGGLAIWHLQFTPTEEI